MPDMKFFNNNISLLIVCHCDPLKNDGQSMHINQTFSLFFKERKEKDEKKNDWIYSKWTISFVVFREKTGKIDWCQLINTQELYLNLIL